MDLTFENKRKARKGRILLADPFADDDYFKRAVVYLCDHNAEGSFGFVLNNFLDVDLYEYTKNFPNIKTRVSIGGPVETQSIYFLHTLGDKIEGSAHVEDGIYIGGDFDQLVQLINDGIVTNKDVRFFLGYAGWSPKQLNEEIKKHAWIVVPVMNRGEVMDFSVDNLWERYMKREGTKYDILSRSPIDISAN